jgi:hypothetical protein
MNNRTIAIVAVVAIVLVASVILARSESSASGGTTNGSTSAIIKDPTNNIFTIANLGIPSLKEQAFTTKSKCQAQGGVINWTGSALLLTCDKIIPFNPTAPEPIIFSEIAEVQSKIDSGQYAPKDEKERLALYFQIVYPNSDPATWTKKTLAELQDYWQGLEVYYKLPASIQPTTQIIVKRRPGKQFYRVPNGVLLDQDPERRGVLASYLEVIRFGPMYNLFADPSLYPGTFYYPAKGSGLFLPLGRTLIAYNKVHAMKLLGAPNSEIVKYGGRDFQSFLRADSAAVAKTPEGQTEVQVTTCVVYKQGTQIDLKKCSTTPKIAGYFTTAVTYSPKALDTLIGEMVAGKCLRYKTKTIPPKPGETATPPKPYLTYYGCGDTGDKFLSQMARNRGYTTIQCLREAQLELSGDAVVGNELIHLVENSYSQASLMRLDPTKMPLYLPEGVTPAYPVNYLLDSSIKPVDLKAVISTEFQPFKQTVLNIDVVVPERN